MKTSIKSLECIMYKAEEVSQVLGLARSTTYEVMHRDDFPLRYIGGRMMVKKDDLLEWIDRQGVKEARG